jgi:alanyl-tRNA synthetase
LTRRLYQEDSYVAEFRARVVSVSDLEGKYAIELDATYFYPEAGGQPGDTGRVGGVPIESTIIAGEGPKARILHLTSARPDFAQGETVEAGIDWAGRFSNMQQHTGQHILSQAFLSAAGAATVSSRLGAEHCTVDVDRLDLGWDDMERVEKLANSVVHENRPVRVYEVSRDEVRGLRRKEPEGLDRIRVVEIEGYDKTPCGGTHTRATGEVGIIKILRWEKVRDTTRVEFICGELARADYAWKSRFVVELAEEHTTKDTNVPGLVRRLYDEHKELRYELEHIRKELAGYRARTLYEAASEEIAGVRVIVAHIEDAAMEEIREIAGLLTSGNVPGSEGVVTLLASGREKVHFVFARSEDVRVDMRPLIKAACSIVEGKGGGRPEACQGGGSHVEKTDQALEEAVRLLSESLEG